uniref:Uncharacterized protein n=1 Tax=Romanomermis culicivorax TaxID=13658 RepID=A0A915HME6_ROMCU
MFLSELRLFDMLRDDATLWHTWTNAVGSSGTRQPKNWLVPESSCGCQVKQRSDSTRSMYRQWLSALRGKNQNHVPFLKIKGIRAKRNLLK